MSLLLSFGPSLQSAFADYLHYYGLCWLLGGSHRRDLLG